MVRITHESVYGDISLLGESPKRKRGVDSTRDLASKSEIRGVSEID